ncbi:MAG: FAD binding domain-containing protein [Blastocatellia bacterium]|nr:FAD binding domain-containing protein [Blastocatellia bacterium]MCS7156814.1 FAD binding domain-containing protein [Blastocatellia bacterium]MCX7752772.1 FAD binding domain-containing protein [Blastocatellia bacterium]MDW8167505.1 xanthine dehydrogenase family protein subunit M [Acidobacteriota bacterium]MDW8256852.1 xanthine dehydrogenase family protein subunit M [Acidobacteriota bacterium]
MLRLPPFRYYAPRSLDEALRILSDHGSEARIVAGGTDLYPKMKRRQIEPRVLISVQRIPELSRIAWTSREGVTLGAGVTLARLLAQEELATTYPALARACAAIAHPPIRSMGTIGGNLCIDTRCTYYDQTFFWREALGFCLKKDGTVCPVAPGGTRCWAVSSSDGAPVMIALGAVLRLIGPHGERTIAAEEFYRDDGIQYLAKAPQEILVEVTLPRQEGWRSTYWKLRRRGAIDFPVLGVAVAVRMESGECRDARIVLGAVGSCPKRIREAERILEGKRLEPDVIEAAAHTVSRVIRPLDNTDFLHLYRKRIASVFTRRALSEIAGAPLAEGVFEM